MPILFLFFKEIFQRFPFFNFMSVSFENYLVVGISSRALFNLEKENEVFEILSDCYESVQLDGDGEILNDIDTLLKNNGVTIE